MRRMTTDARKVGNAMRPGTFVVDDDADIREILRLLLEDAGYQVSEASDGASALVMLRKMREPHVVLLDQCLPGLTGGSLLQTVAHDATLRSRHAYVLLTANTCTQAQEVVRSVPHMDVAVITKPFDVENLLDTISTVTVRLTGLPATRLGEQPQPLM